MNEDTMYSPDGPANFADTLLDPTQQFYLQRIPPNSYQTDALANAKFQQAVQHFNLPPPEGTPQVCAAQQPHQDVAISGEPSDQFDITDYISNLCDTISIDSLQKLADQCPTEIDDITPSLALLPSQPAVQQSVTDAVNQQQLRPIQLPDSTVVAMAMALSKQGTSESPTIAPIAVINPLTNDVAQSESPSPPTVMMTNQNAQTQMAYPLVDLTQTTGQTTNPVFPTIANSSTNSTAHPESQCEMKKKSKRSQKKRKVEPKTPSSSPPSSLEIQKKKQKTPSTSLEKKYPLPTEKNLRVRLFYQSHKIVDKQVNSHDGLLVYHKKAWAFQDANLDLAKVEFPQLENFLNEQLKKWSDEKHRKEQLKEQSEKQPKKQPKKQLEKQPDVDPPLLKPYMTKHQINYTQTLLEAMAKGIHVRCDENGNIYAQRFCKSHVYCYTTEPEIGVDMATVPIIKLQQLVFYQINLEQGKDTKIFDIAPFHEKLTQKYIYDKTVNIPSPLLILAFGQKWQQGFPLNNNLVYMKITPEKAREQSSLEPHSMDCDKASLQTSFSSLSMNSH